jgi:hypothetical protein
MKKSDKMRQLLNNQTVKKNLTVENKVEIKKEVEKEQKQSVIDKIKKKIVRKKG